MDAAVDAAIYRTVLSARQPANRMVVIPDATHGLLKAGSYNYQLPSQWPLWAKGRFLLEGRFAYALGALDAITGFMNGLPWRGEPLERIEANDPGRCIAKLNDRVGHLAAQAKIKLLTGGASA